MEYCAEFRDVYPKVNRMSKLTDKLIDDIIKITKTNPMLAIFH